MLKLRTGLQFAEEQQTWGSHASGFLQRNVQI